MPDTPLPRYAAPEGGVLADAMRADYDASGVLILANFVSRARCDELRRRAMELVEAFDPPAVPSVFSTDDEQQLDERYFIESGDRTRFFHEAEADDGGGRLLHDKSVSLHKMGHAMHDLDPVFDRFSHTPELARIAGGVGPHDPVIIQSMYIDRRCHYPESNWLQRSADLPLRGFHAAGAQAERG